MSLKLYFDLMSQPSRALYVMLKTCKVPFEPVKVNLAKGEHFTEQFEKINKFKKVPVIDHNGFVLTESIVIPQYLSREKILPEKYYPTDSKIRARVDEFLSWHQFNLRAPCALYFQIIVLHKVLTGSEANPKVIEKRKETMSNALDLFEEKVLGQGTKFIVGDSPTIADLFGCCEVEQPRIAGYDPTEGRPNLASWMELVKKEFNPYYDEANVIIEKMIAKRATSKM